MAILSLIFQVLLAEKYGGLGVAYAIAGGLVLGNVVIMNIYYHRKQHIDMIQFWEQILKMSIAPTIIGIGTYYIIREFNFESFGELVIAIVVFSSVYLPVFWFFSMNKSERELLKKPIAKLLKRN
jgi:O-antigen/teichoic acid export membrane protein